ncbi:diaminopimelate epimerase [Halorubrum gandharaense]
MSIHAVPVEKYHGTGNDFLVVDASEMIADRAAFAEAHCDRETGANGAYFGANGGANDDDRLGADGVLFLSIEERYRPTRVVMTLVQPDGSTAAMCGNGARVVARWAHDRTGETEFMIDTQAGTRRATVTSDGSEATIEMGVPRFAPGDVPVDTDEPLVEAPVEGLTVTAVNTGVPHAVAFVEDVDEIDLETAAPPVRHAPIFPDGANVNLVTVVEDGFGNTPKCDSEAGEDADVTPVIAQRTFERGVEGETRSCGTGAVAVAAVARRLGLVDGETIRIRPPGGELAIEVPEGEAATLTGPVTHEFSGELPADPR